MKESLLINVLSDFQHNVLSISKKTFRFLVSKIKKKRANYQNMNELRGLNSHELSDIGMSRIDLEKIIKNPREKDTSLRKR